jgi:hypothetical protein
LLTIVTGDDAGRNRAPDVVGRIAPLLGGELHRVAEDRREHVGVHLGAFGLHLQNVVESVENARPILFRNADDVADHGHRQRVGDIVDPVAASAGEQVVDHPRRTGPNAVFEFGDRPWRKGTRNEFSVLALLRRIQGDDRRIRREQVGRLDKRTVYGRERLVVAVQPHGVPVFGRHPEILLDGLCDARRQPVAEQRPAAA